MKRRRTPRRDAGSVVAFVAIAAIVVAAQTSEGGRLGALVQPTAVLVVFGGTGAALLLSFPWPHLRRALRATARVLRHMPDPDPALVARFEHYAGRVIRRGPMALEPEIAQVGDPFLARAIGMIVDGVSVDELRQALTTFSRAREDADEECALVLETAAGYAPTLGILGAVLGLIRVMENLATPAAVGAGIAVAFVATVYGVGIANLVLLPLASRLRTMSRTAALTRELIIEGAVVLRRAAHPRLVEAYLTGFLRSRPAARGREAA